MTILKLLSFRCLQTGITRVGVMVDGVGVLDASRLDVMRRIAPLTSDAVMDMTRLIAHCDASSVSELRKVVEDRDFPAADLIPLSAVQILAPIPLPHRNVFCVGKNYLDHISEVQAALAGVVGSWSTTAASLIPKHAYFFTKAPQCVIAHLDHVESHAKITQALDYEAELAVIIGRGGRNISREDAFSHVFGYTIANDITARDLQRRHNQWFKGKTLDTFCPLGPVIVPASQLDPSGLDIKLWVNGELRQDSNTRNMIFDIPDIIHQLSSGFTLHPGDIILTGTPDGVGFAMSPPQFLKQGDVVDIEIEHIGRLSNAVL